MLKRGNRVNWAIMRDEEKGSLSEDFYLFFTTLF